VVRWARLLLPNGQVARSRWKEDDYGEDDDIRVSRHVKVILNGSPRIAEVHYFMNLTPDLTEANEKPVAVVSMFGPPHAGLLAESSRTYYTCEHFRDIDVQVLDVESIQSVVMMAP
ncbi:hypothetical protein K525DRAFT_171447, partial [Schizophyllum commune Loenen D]